MNKQEDIEICKKIAEIEEFTVLNTIDDSGNEVLLFGSDSTLGMSCRNLKFSLSDEDIWGYPRHMNTLLGYLILKYDLDFISPYRRASSIYEVGVFVDGDCDAICIYDENPYRAVFLAVIEAKEQ